VCWHRSRESEVRAWEGSRWLEACLLFFKAAIVACSFPPSVSNFSSHSSRPVFVVMSFFFSASNSMLRAPDLAFIMPRSASLVAIVLFSFSSPKSFSLCASRSDSSVSSLSPEIGIRVNAGSAVSSAPQLKSHTLRKRAESPARRSNTVAPASFCILKSAPMGGGVEEVFLRAKTNRGRSKDQL